MHIVRVGSKVRYRDEHGTTWPATVTAVTDNDTINLRVGHGLNGFVITGAVRVAHHNEDAVGNELIEDPALMNYTEGFYQSAR